MTAPWPTTSASSSSGPTGARRRCARPPCACPRYDHVFLFYFENQDVHAIVGNRRQAPYYNSLLSRGSQLGDLFAEEHPSDANYLALAGGSAFGVPLDDPLEYDSQYTIHAPNIGDLVDAAGETWKAYNESAAGPCDDTVHGYYWDDDLPFLYFADIRAAARLLRRARAAAGVDGARPRQRGDDAQLRVGRLQRLRRHGGMRHPRRRPLPPRAAEPDHALARVAHPAVAGDHHLG